MAKFPSVKWFKAIQELVNGDDRLRKLGTCDAIMGVKVQDKAFEIISRGQALPLHSPV